MAESPRTTDSGPVQEPARITSLDLIRGVAVLGILLMNAVSFKFGHGPNFNLSAGGSETWLDWTVGIFGEVFIDQKFMGLFSMLFGAGMILFIDRASARGRRAVLLNLWRNALLLLIGVLHFLLWDGDVLMAYALSSVFLIALRKLPNRALISLGIAVFTLSVATTLQTQHNADTTSASLAGLWTPGETSDEEVIWIPFLSGFLLRRTGPDPRRRRLVSHRLHERPLASEDIQTDRDGRACGRLTPRRSRRHPNRCERLLARGRLRRPNPQHPGHHPAAMGYMSLIILWNNHANSWLKQRLRAVGRMAVTNYLTQTVLGVVTLTVLLSDVDFINRSAVLAFVLAVWALQLWWSQAWLNCYQFGPAEWLWRVATYRSLQPLRRTQDSQPAR